MYMMAVHPWATEIRQQGRVDVDHPAPKPRDHGGRHELQVSGEHHELRVRQRGVELSGVLDVVQHRGRDPRLARARKRPGVSPVRNDTRDPRDWRILERIEEGLQVRAAARHEHSDTNRLTH